MIVRRCSKRFVDGREPENSGFAFLFREFCRELCRKKTKKQNRIDKVCDKANDSFIIEIQVKLDIISMSANF